MPRTSETIGAIAAALAKAQGRTQQSGEVPHRHPPFAVPPRKMTKPSAMLRWRAG